MPARAGLEPQPNLDSAAQKLVGWGAWMTLLSNAQNALCDLLFRSTDWPRLRVLTIEGRLLDTIRRYAGHLR